MTEKQDMARTRNFNIMVLRGTYQQLRRIEHEHPILQPHVSIILKEIDTCLAALGAETQTSRRGKFRGGPDG